MVLEGIQKQKREQEATSRKRAKLNPCTVKNKTTSGEGNLGIPGAAWSWGMGAKNKNGPKRVYEGKKIGGGIVY